MSDIPLAARTQVLLQGVPLPATRDQLLAYARDAGAADDVLDAIARHAPERLASLDALGEAIAPTEPGTAPPSMHPRPKSGAPPGGPSYLDPSPEPGSVRATSGDGPAS